LTQTNGFLDMDLSKPILRAVDHMGFQDVTPVQAKTIPVMMAGSDIIAIAPTGTGKTVAYGIPMMEYISLKDMGVQELVLAPTRELALQIAEELAHLAKYIPEIRICTLYGGQPIARQMAQLKRRPQIVVATPGRMLDHLQRGTVNLSGVHTMVIDEADEMLKMGFVKDVTRIVEATPPTRQLVMFSATSNQDLMTISWKYQKTPVEITIEATRENRPQITQYVIRSSRESKYDRLLYLLDADVYGRIMVFVNTKAMARRLSERLLKAGYSVDSLHGDIPQNKRNQVMAAFKSGRFSILICTDVAARGIDVDDVEAVINYDLPNENEYYIHRIGRTGRARKNGVSFTLETFQESVRMDEILRYIKSRPIRLSFNELGILEKEDRSPFFSSI
jgi:ATP-dependent RNA helicase DeaD